MNIASLEVFRIWKVKKIKSNRDSFYLLNITTRTLGMNYITFIFTEIKINLTLALIIFIDWLYKVGCKYNIELEKVI